MSSNNRTQPIDSISQGDTTTREYVLARPVDGNPYQWEAVDLTTADRVGISLTHVNGGGTMVDNAACTIENAEDGIVSYTYSKNETWNPAGGYHAQFHIDWSGSPEESLPPDGYEWWLDLGPKQGGVPINTPRIRADIGEIDDLRTTDLETDTLKVNDWISGLIEDTTQSDHISRFDGANLEVGPTGSLGFIDPIEDGYVEGSDHFHLNSTTGGDQVYPRDLRVAGHPVFDVTHPDYGAEGDGTADDTAAIQSAINDAQAAGGVVFLPPGIYFITGRLTITGSVTIRGTPQSWLLPHYTTDESAGRVLNAIWIDGASDVTLENFGVRGDSNAQADYEADGTLFGTYARIAGRNGCENIEVRTLRGLYVKNLVDIRTGGGIYVDGLHLRDSSLPLHLGDGVTGGTVSNIFAQRCSTVLDFGGGASDFSVSNLFGQCNDWREEEAIDVGGGKNISVTGCVFKDFPRAFNVKGENGESWDNVSFSDVIATGLTTSALYATRGSEPGPMTDISVSDSTFRADFEEDASGNYVYPDVRGLETNASVRGVTFENCTVHTTGHAMDLNGAADATVIGCDLESENAEALMGSSGALTFENVSVANTRCESHAAQGAANAVDLAGARGVSGLSLNNVNVLEGSGGTGIYVSNCARPQVRNCDVQETYSDGIHVRHTTVGSVDDSRSVVDARIEGNSVRNMGVGNTGRHGIQFTLNLTLNTPRNFEKVRVVDNDVRVRDNHDTNDHTGMRFNIGGDVTGLSHVRHQNNDYHDVGTGVTGTASFVLPYENSGQITKTNV